MRELTVRGALGVHWFFPWTRDPRNRTDSPFNKMLDLAEKGTDISGLKVASILAAAIFVASPAYEQSRSRIEVIVPVPSPESRHLTRGWRITEVIADEFGQTLHVPVIAHAVRTVGHPPELRTTTLSRREALAGKFVVYQPRQIQGKGVLLVDDLFVSGETVRKVTRLLKESGASTIDVVTLGKSE